MKRARVTSCCIQSDRFARASEAKPTIFIARKAWLVRARAPGLCLRERCGADRGERIELSVLFNRGSLVELDYCWSLKNNVVLLLFGR